MKYKQSLITSAWAIAGILISTQIIAIGRLSLFGYPLFFLSVLLALLAFWYAIKKR